MSALVLSVVVLALGLAHVLPSAISVAVNGMVILSGAS